MNNTHSKIQWRSVAFLFLVALLAACGRNTPTSTLTPALQPATPTTTRITPTAKPTSTSTYTATAAPILIVTSTRTQEPTLTSTSTLQPSPQPSATSTPILVPAPVYTYRLPPAFASLRLAYNEQGWLWVWQNNLAMAITRLGVFSSLAFSPDGSQIAFIRDHALWLIDADGAHERLFISAEEMKKITPWEWKFRLIWVPEAPGLLIYTISEDIGGPIQDNNLYLVDIQSGELKMIFEAGQGGDINISPDGKTIAVVSGENIRLMNLDGSNQRTVLTYYFYRYMYYDYYPRIHWAADSQSLIAEIHSGNPFSTPVMDQYPTRDDALVSIWRIPVNGKPYRLFQTTSAMYLDFSDNFSRFAYVKDNGDRLYYELHIANANRTNDKVYYTAGDESAYLYFWGWAPDSKSFVLSSHDDTFYWMKIGETVSQTVKIKPGGAPSMRQVIWFDNTQFLILTYAYSGIWVSAPGAENIQIAQFADLEANQKNFFNTGFDISYGNK